jgi:hypothetical protein
MITTVKGRSSHGSGGGSVIHGQVPDRAPMGNLNLPVHQNLEPRLNGMPYRLPVATRAVRGSVFRFGRAAFSLEEPRRFPGAPYPPPVAVTPSFFCFVLRQKPSPFNCPGPESDSSGFPESCQHLGGRSPHFSPAQERHRHKKLAYTRSFLLLIDLVRFDEDEAHPANAHQPQKVRLGYICRTTSKG